MAVRQWLRIKWHEFYHDGVSKLVPIRSGAEINGPGDFVEKQRYFSATRELCIYIYIPPVALRPNAGHGLLILYVSRSHTTTHYSR